MKWIKQINLAHYRDINVHTIIAIDIVKVLPTKNMKERWKVALILPMLGSVDVADVATEKEAMDFKYSLQTEMNI
jgi:hypothetical protein